MITLRPLGDRVVIIPDVAEEEKVGHIIIPETNVKERPKGGTIVAIGDDEELNENLKVGDRVVYANYGGTQTRIDHQDYVVACYNDILLVLEDKVEEAVPDKLTARELVKVGDIIKFTRFSCGYLLDTDFMKMNDYTGHVIGIDRAKYEDLSYKVVAKIPMAKEALIGECRVTVHWRDVTNSTEGYGVKL